MTEGLTMKRTAEILGVSKQQVGYLLKKGIITGEKVNGMWMINEETVLERERIMGMAAKAAMR